MKLLVVCFIGLSLFITGCETTVINRGYVVETADFSKIKVGKDNAMSVFEILGSPTIRSSLMSKNGEYSWYYVSKRTEKTSFLEPKVVDQKTIVITFDNNNIVKSVTKSTYEKPISTVSETTKTEGKTSGVFGETFGGIGKYLKRHTEKGK